MELPEPERVELARALLRSLSPEGAVDDAQHTDPALTAELQRRRREYLAGEVDSVSLEELERDLDGVLAAVHR